MSANLRINPNERIIAHFPFREGIRPLNRSERDWAQNSVRELKETLKSQKLQAGFLSFNGVETDRYNLLRDEANKFFIDQTKGAPTNHPYFPKLHLDWNDVFTAKLTLVLEKLYKKQPGLNILHIGCGFGPVMAFVKRGLKANVYGLEVNGDAVNIGSTLGNHFILKGMAQHMPWAGEKFDAVITWHFLCYNYPRGFFPFATEEEMETITNELFRNQEMLLPHGIKMLGQLQKVIKPGGHLISYNEDMVNVLTASAFFSSFVSIDGGSLIALQK